GGGGPRAPVWRYRSGPIATAVGAARVAARPCRERGAGRIGGRWWQPGGRGFRAAAAAVQPGRRRGRGSRSVRGSGGPAAAAQASLERAATAGGGGGGRGACPPGEH